MPEKTYVCGCGKHFSLLPYYGVPNACPRCDIEQWIEPIERLIWQEKNVTVFHHCYKLRFPVSEMPCVDSYTRDSYIIKRNDEEVFKTGDYLDAAMKFTETLTGKPFSLGAYPKTEEQHAR